MTSARCTLGKVSETIPVLFCPGKKDVGPRADVSDYVKRYVIRFVLNYQEGYSAAFYLEVLDRT